MTNMDPRLVDWFADEEDEGDAPELHLVGLQPGDVERSLAVLVELGARWSDRTFHIDDEEIEFFWWPDREWSAERVAASFALLARLLALAPLVGDRVEDGRS